MPIRDRSISSARLVDGGCQDVMERQFGEALHTSQGQEISPQVWKILPKKVSINTMLKTKEEVIGLYTKEKCSILSGMVKYIPVQTSREVMGKLLIELS